MAKRKQCHHVRAKSASEAIALTRITAIKNDGIDPLNIREDDVEFNHKEGLWVVCFEAEEKLFQKLDIEDIW